MKRLLAISLLFIFIAGQVNLTWATHFCGQYAVQSSVSLGEDDLSCGIEEESCCDEDEGKIDGPIITGEECCSNGYYSSDADDYFLKVDSENDRFVQLYNIRTITFYPQFNFTEYNSYLAKDIPILIPPDKQVLFQTFLL